MISVMLVDDHPVVTEGLTVLLSEIANLEVIATARGGEEAIELYDELRPDVVLMDLSMPGMNGVAATRQITSLDPGARVLALTGFVDDDLVADVLAAGAHGYLLKSSSGSELHDAIRTIADGRSVLSDEALRHLAVPRDRRRIGDDLTPREVDVLDHLVHGLSNKQIAAELGLQPGTVRIHVSNILAKLGAENRTAAAHIARINGLDTGPT